MDPFSLSISSQAFSCMWAIFCHFPFILCMPIFFPIIMPAFIMAETIAATHTTMSIMM